MSTTSKSFTAIGSSDVFYLRQGESALFTVSGTFSASWALEKVLGNGVAVEKTLLTGTGTTSATVKADQDMILRVSCTAFTSGTMDTSIADVATDTVKEFLNRDGVQVLEVTDQGIETPNAIITNLDIPNGGTFDLISASGFKVTIAVASIATADRTYTLPDAGSGANIMLANASATPGAAVSSATGSEVSRNCDVSSRVVNVTSSTLSVTEATHEGKDVTINRAAGCTVTLPDSTGGGARYRFVIGTTMSGGSTVIKVANSTDVMEGNSFVVSDDTAAVKGFKAAATDDTITLNGTTLGGYKGDIIECWDLHADRWTVRVLGAATGVEATPFSSTV